MQLFDLTNDPHELHDLASLPESAPHMRRLQAELASWQERCGDRWTPVSAGDVVKS